MDDIYPHVMNWATEGINLVVIPSLLVINMLPTAPEQGEYIILHYLYTKYRPLRQLIGERPAAVVKIDAMHKSTDRCCLLEFVETKNVLVCVQNRCGS